MELNKAFFLPVSLSAALLPNAKGQEENAQGKPNILMFMVDQMIPMFSGPYGNDVAITPNLDKLAAEGIVFENACTTCPVCVPSSYSLLTGIYPASHGAYDNGGILRSDIPTHNHYLNLAGYETCCRPPAFDKVAYNIHRGSIIN